MDCSTSSEPNRVILTWGSSSSWSSELSRNVGAITRSELANRSGTLKSSTASSRCNPARRDEYQIQRRNVALAPPSSAGEFSGIDVLYSLAPVGTALGKAPVRRCGRWPATAASIAQTSSGGSSTENTVTTEIE